MMARIFYEHWNAVTRRYFAAQDFACVGFAQNKGLGISAIGCLWIVPPSGLRPPSQRLGTLPDPRR
jgi:hypothetical protein